MTSTHEPGSPSNKPWKPIGRNLRRVLGVLIEKAKTTPDSYPLTVSSLIAGCKQKSNRDPMMELDEDEVTDALDRLKSLGAVREIQGSGRVNKYRHCAYEWLDVTAAQAAVMTELLLRGPQTLGELRARASRMETFEGLEVVQKIVGELEAKGLVFPVTPAGRGQVFAHSLYEPQELDKLREKFSFSTAAGSGTTSPVKSNEASGTTRVSLDSQVESASIRELADEIRRLRTRVERLESELGLGSEDSDE